MSRHTLDDGVTPDTRIISGISYDEHLAPLAPPAKLVGAYYRHELDFADYEKRYRDYLTSSAVVPIVKNLVRRALDENITFLCIEESPEKCHRKILALFLSEISSSHLVVDIK